MAQIVKKFIGSNAVDGTKIRLNNNEALRARNAADSGDINLLKVNASDKIEFSSVPQSTSDASAGNDLVRLSQLTAFLEGLKPKAAVIVATTVAGTLATDFAAGQVVDTHTLVAGERILLKDQAAPAENGIYVVQASGAPVRAVDFDLPAEIPGSYTVAELGSNQGNLFVCLSSPVTLGTDAINFASRTITIATYTGGDMIALSAGAFSVDLASVSGLESSNPGNAAGQLRVKLEASNPSLKIDGSNQLAAKLDGSGAITSGASGLIVGVDNSTIEINTNALRVKAGGITNNEVNASAAIDFSKLAALPSADILVGSAGNVATAVSMSGEALIDASGAVTLSNAAVIGKVLTGYTAGAGSVTSADSILSAIQKVDGNDQGKATKALDNLASVAINTSLLPASDASCDLGSTSLNFNHAYIKNSVVSNIVGDSGAFTTGFTVRTTDGAFGSVGTGNMVLRAGDNSDTSGASGGVIVRSGKGTGSGASSGPAYFQSGAVTVGTGNTGVAHLSSGNTVDGTSGSTWAMSGNASGTGGSGPAQLGSGTTVGGNSGTSQVSTGNSSSGGTTGSIQLNVGTTSGTRGNISLNGASINANSTQIHNVADGSSAQDASAFHQIADAINASGGDMIAASAGVLSVDLATSSGLQSTNPGNAAGQLQVKTDGSTIDINGSNQVEVKNLGITVAKITSGAATSGQVLTADGSGNASFANPASAPVALEQHPTLSGTDITNQYYDLAHVAAGSSATVNSISLGVYGGLEQLKGTDYTVSLTGGAGGVTRITFAGDLATGGNAALVATDILMIKYSY